MIRALLLACLAAPSSATETPPDPWQALWLPNPASVRPEGRTSFDGVEYEALATKHFRLLYPTRRAEREADRRMPLHVAARLDNLYEFLAARMGARPEQPVTAVLLAGIQGRSRTIPEKNAILTGDQGDAVFVLGSYLHELVHLFNFSIPDARQDSWSGEIFAQYHGDRLSSLGLEHRKRYRRPLSADAKTLDWSWIHMLDEHFSELPERESRQLLELGLSVYYFLEDEFGASKTLCFWRAHLDPAQNRDEALWARCFGESEDELRARWRRYYRIPAP